MSQAEAEAAPQGANIRSLKRVAGAASSGSSNSVKRQKQNDVMMKYFGVTDIASSQEKLEDGDTLMEGKTNYPLDKLTGKRTMRKRWTRRLLQR